MPVRPTTPLALSIAAVLAAGTLTACGGGTGSDPDTVKIAFPKDTDNKVTVRDNYVKDMAKTQFEKQHNRARRSSSSRSRPPPRTTSPSSSR